MRVNRISPILESLSPSSIILHCWFNAQVRVIEICRKREIFVFRTLLKFSLFRQLLPAKVWNFAWGMWLERRYRTRHVFWSFFFFQSMINRFQFRNFLLFVASISNFLGHLALWRHLLLTVCWKLVFFQANCPPDCFSLTFRNGNAVSGISAYMGDGTWDCYPFNCMNMIFLEVYRHAVWVQNKF